MIEHSTFQKAEHRERMLGYPTSVVEGVGDEFISVRESLIS